MERTLFRNILAVIGRHRMRLFQGVLLVTVSNLLQITNPMILRRAVNSVESGGGSIAWALLLLSIAALASLFNYWMRMAFISVSREEECQLRSRLYSRLQGQSATFFDNHGIGELLSRLTNDISIYRDVLGPGIMYPIYFLTLIIPAIVALFYISSYLAWLSLMPIFLLPVVNMSLKRVIYPLSMAVQRGLGRMSAMVQEHYSGIRLIKAFGAQRALGRIFNELARGLIRYNRNLSIIQGLLYPFFALITKSITVLLVLFAGGIILFSWAPLTGADLVSFMWIQSYIYVPVLMLGWVLPVYERGRSSYERLREIYCEPNAVSDDSAVDFLSSPPAGEIVIRDLTFTYSGATSPSLRNLSLKVDEGTFIGITGPVGAGKTTLLQLIARDYDVDRGKIAIGGNDIHDYPLALFKRGLVTVEQVPFIFSRTIKENIRFGLPDAAKELVELVTGHADLHDTIVSFPEGYETIVGERGVTLSGGQKQRLAIARAFLLDRGILLLDDIFSAVDAETEKRIFSSMRRHFLGKTVLLVTHRVSILRQLDRVLYMHDGTIIEDGTPSELELTGGSYAALVKLQQLEGKEGV